MGAFVLHQMEMSGMNPAHLVFDGKHFEAWLSREDDRALFGLNALIKPKEEDDSIARLIG